MTPPSRWAIIRWARATRYRLRSVLCRHEPDVLADGTSPWTDEGAPYWVCGKCGAETAAPEEAMA